MHDGRVQRAAGLAPYTAPAEIKFWYMVEAGWYIRCARVCGTRLAICMGTSSGSAKLKKARCPRPRRRRRRKPPPP